MISAGLAASSARFKAAVTIRSSPDSVPGAIALARMGTQECMNVLKAFDVHVYAVPFFSVKRTALQSFALGRAPVLESRASQNEAAKRAGRR
jgi:hypothetical protein